MLNVVTTLDALRAVVDDYLKQDAFVFDVETMPRPGAPSAWRGDPRRNVVKWIALATAGRADVIPLGHPNGEFLGWDRPLLKTGRDRLAKGLELREQDYSRDQKKWTPQFAPPPEQLCWSVDVRDVLRPLFFSELTKIGHNLAFDLESIAKHFDGEIPPPPHADTMIAGFLLDPGDKGHLSLKDCSKRELDFDMVKGVGKEIEAHSFDEVARYAWRDARLTWLLWSTVYEQELRDTGLWNLWRLEMDVLQVVVHMEMTGAPVDESRLRQLDGELRGMQTDVEVEILRLAGNPDLNINSNEQVSRLLYSPKKEGGQGLKPRILTDGGKKRKEAGEDLTFKDYSVSDDALKYHEGNTLVDNLRRYGDIERLITGFIVPYLGGENTNGKAVESLLIDGRIHGRFNQIGAETGRFCVSPDTLVEMPRDLTKYPDGVPLRDVRAGDWVYSFTWDKRLVLRQVKWVGPTKIADTVLVTIRDKYGKITRLTCSQDHLVRRWDGDWAPAGSLKSGDRLMGMLQRRYSDSGHAYFPPSKKRALPGKETGGKVYEHRWVYQVATGRRPSTKSVVHHIDHNEKNNHWSNLMAMSPSDHAKHHHAGVGVEDARRMLAGEIPSTITKKSLQRIVRTHDRRLSPTNHTVVSVEPGPSQVQLWDCEIEDTNTFIGSDVALHNSSREPNLQQVPARSEEGKRIRSAFVAPPGYKLVVADYSQIEPRILADLSQEPALLEAYLQEGGDVYTALASPFGFDRQVGKTMFLSIAYGTGPSKLASVTGLSLAESKSIIYEKFPKAFPKIEAAKQAVVRGARARKPPHIRTLLGRRRYLPGLLSSDTYVRSRNERQAFNSYIQGSAADINKIGLVRTDQSVTPLGASPILTVHDEVVVLTPEQHAEEVAHLVTEAMTGVHLLKTVPLVAETKIADNWADGK